MYSTQLQKIRLSRILADATLVRSNASLYRLNRPYKVVCQARRTWTPLACCNRWTHLAYGAQSSGDFVPKKAIFTGTSCTEPSTLRSSTPLRRLPRRATFAGPLASRCQGAAPWTRCLDTRTLPEHLQRPERRMYWGDRSSSRHQSICLGLSTGHSPPSLSTGHQRTSSTRSCQHASPSSCKSAAWCNGGREQIAVLPTRSTPVTWCLLLPKNARVGPVRTAALQTGPPPWSQH